MKKLASLALVFSLVTGVSAAPEPRSSPRSIDSFGAKLHTEVAKAKAQPKARTRPNLVYSPASVAIALAMTREGARAQTAAEMDAVLGAGAGADARALLKSLGAPAGKPAPGMPMAPELSIVNRLFGEQTTVFEQPFLDTLRDGYGAPIETVDFKQQHEAARAKINAWVERQTRSRIKDLHVKGTIIPDTRLVLVNAIYLKAQWAVPFEVSATRPAKFAVESAGDKQVPTMRTEARGSWGSHAGARVLDLPYAAGAGGPQLSMMLVVPETAKLGEIEATYARGGLAPFRAAIRTHGKVQVALPKFKVAADFDLGESLEGMGMPRAFSNEAEFGGISKLPTKISKVIHKAWIQVDEKGTEAAAATAVVMMEITSVDRSPVHSFPVDRSFLFFIHDQNGTVLFGGRVIDPS